MIETTEIKDVSDLHAAVGPERLIKTLRSQCVPYLDPARQKIEELLTPRRYSAAKPPPAERVVYRIDEATIATPGNLLGLYAQPKAGKTAFMGGLLGATMGREGDTFHVYSSNAEGRAVIHFDTEQSPAHHYKAITRALRRVGLEAEPAWLYSYRMADVDMTNRRVALQQEIRSRHQQHGGIHSVFLDGIADFIRDPNNPEEAFAWVEEMHQLAIQYDTVIVCVLHENPYSEFGKTRGHLGSQLERKAETNLRMTKDVNNVTTVFTERSRQAHIPKDAGPRFVFDLEAMMHVSCEKATVPEVSAKALEMRMFVDQIFADVPAKTGLGWKDIIERIRDIDELSPGGARKRLASLESAGAVRHSAKRYYRGK